MTYPAKPIITYSYTGFQAARGDNSFPGTQMDADIAALKTAASTMVDFVKLFANSDGTLKSTSFSQAFDLNEATAVALEAADTATNALLLIQGYSFGAMAFKGHVDISDHANFSGASKLLGSGASGASPVELSIGGALTMSTNVLMGGFFTNFAAFTSAGATTWTCPAGVTRAKVTVIGGGAAGGSSGGATGVGGGGGAGGMAVKWFTDLVPGTIYNLTVGAAANASSFTGPSATPTGNGGTAGSGNAAVTAGGAGGTASGGDINLPGSSGANGFLVAATGGNGGNGGAGPFGGAGRGAQLAGTGQNNGIAGAAPGAGGGGGIANSGTSGTGGAGAAGAVIIEY
ncbi:hypothetical protein [Rhizobium phaseoli]|uniref:glycine-rich domain-containing protein n=1 Tax=Rhizobium phaseoli TaxID=396 RepID=UPI0025558F04|nr:hypothetical protein [Rhizobium phaseoli]MDK4729354.1 hypothetical protein [Rhizobium phaseoli]